MEKITIINSDNAYRWEAIFTLVDKINALKSVEEFYGTVEPPCYGLKEVYDRLHGWRKRAFRQFIMSGDFVLEHWKFNNSYDLKYWGLGRYNEHANRCFVNVHHYDHPVDWEDYTEEKSEWSWSQICAALPI